MTDDELKQARLEKARRIAKGEGAAAKGAVNYSFIEYETAPVRAVFRALELCNWHPPVDPDLLIAREAVAQIWNEIDSPNIAASLRAGVHDEWSAVIAALAAIKLYKSRTGA